MKNILILLLSVLGLVTSNKDIVSTDPTLIRSGEPSARFLRRLHDEHGLRTIVNLREKSFRAEASFAEANKDVTVYVFNWRPDTIPPKEDIDRLLALYRDPDNFPMLVHCRAGKDRAGLAVALWRIEMEGWRPEDAMAEMEEYGYSYARYPAMQDAIRERYKL